MDSGDIVGLISCIAGTVLLVIPIPDIARPIASIAGGVAVLVMGIVGVAKDSKIGIGGIILGPLCIISGLIYLFLLPFLLDLLETYSYSL
ncbi:MAG: hypothetical protein ACFFAT_03350 [Promethearchaeota archaeon]